MANGEVATNCLSKCSAICSICCCTLFHHRFNWIHGKSDFEKKNALNHHAVPVYIYIIIYFVFFQNLFLEQIAFQHFVMIFHFVSLYAAAAVRGTSFGCAVVPFAAWSFKAIQYGKGHSICQGIGVQGRSLKVTEA